MHNIAGNPSYIDVSQNVTKFKAHGNMSLSGSALNGNVVLPFCLNAHTSALSLFFHSA